VVDEGTTQAKAGRPAGREGGREEGREEGREGRREGGRDEGREEKARVRKSGAAAAGDTTEATKGVLDHETEKFKASMCVRMRVAGPCVSALVCAACLAMAMQEQLEAQLQADGNVLAAQLQAARAKAEAQQAFAAAQMFVPGDCYGTRESVQCRPFNAMQCTALVVLPSAAAANARRARTHRGCAAGCI
jgi:hypothetical protein